MKIKLPEIHKRFPNGELYVFKNGVAVVPGMRTKNVQPYTITMKEFKEHLK